ncbi:hypothetical protein SARC_11031 [Sphaeroforma arctica JP610]|uniref:Exportin-1 C-terminal domain-containing protein n=1 Tax=Sphaeroforma arctica JP610 TaxID=667725 RepID=A0A0L0FKA8_9EUKA|nr:hypothetical protein SARC_11031 [Sphaeroforma arctica JP610]KNC76468.1 hypothetical protein SARC_11031 [Sphaeroforma arctica JP610]|eukprot:XP_014150370.1 hypothetical protein SARC_11031 [Sphaeroforma arctica JP610]
MRSHNFRVSELSCQAIRISLTNATDLAKGLLGNPPDSRVRSAMGFLQKYYLAVLPVALDVLLDTALESRFFDTCALLSMMVRLLTQDQVPALYPDCEPMSGTTDAPNDTVEANTTAAKNVIASHLLNTRGRLQRSQVLQFCDRVFLDFGNVRALGFVLKDLMKAIKSSEVEPEHGEETLHI